MNCPGCHSPGAAGANFCSVCGHKLTAAEGPPLLPPAEELETAERRLITVLFSDFVGYLDWSRGFNEEELDSVMHGLWTGLDRIIREHGGVPEKHAGDAVMAVFGRVGAREEVAVAAVRAGLAMQRWLRARAGEPGGVPPANRIGIASGLMLVRPSLRAGEFLATGETAGLASRLQALAPPGGVLIAHETYRQVLNHFNVAAQPDQPVRGLADLQATYLVHSEKPRDAVGPGEGIEDTPMVGRELELTRLQAALGTVVTHREPHACLVTGEAGLGKSRLLHEFREWLEPRPEFYRLFRGRAVAELRDAPFALVRNLFTARLEIHENDPPAAARDKFEQGLAALLGPAAGGETAADIQFAGQLLGFDYSADPLLRELARDPAQVQRRAFAAFPRLLAALARGPVPPPYPGVAAVVMLVEDLHWADAGSLALLEHLATRCAGVPLLIVGSARPDFFERGEAGGRPLAGAEGLPLAPLTPSQSETLVREILGRAAAVPAPLREYVLEPAEGNPYFIREMINMLRDLRVLARDPAQSGVDTGRLTGLQVPGTIHGVLQARLDGLPRPERRVLQRAAVVGRDFWAGAVARLAPGEEPSPDELARVFAALERKDFIFRRRVSAFAATVEYRFKHELMRQVAYENLLRGRRREYHGRMAEWLRGQGAERSHELAGQAATHCELADRTAEAADWHGRAGELAKAGFAHAAADRHFRRALDLAQRPGGSPDSGRHRTLVWWEGLAETLGAQGSFAKAAAAAEAMQTLARDLDAPLAQARAANLLAFLHERGGDNRASIACAREAEGLAARAGVPGRGELARAWYLQGWAHYRLTEVAAVLAFGEQLRTLCGEDGNRRGEALACKLLGVARLQQSRFAEADDYFERGRVIFAEQADLRNTAAMWSNRGEVARARGDREAAEHFYDHALALARRTGNQESELIYRTNRGAARLGAGDFAAVAAEMQAVITATHSANSCILAEAYTVLGEARLELGQLEAATDAGLQSVTLARAAENLLHLAGALRLCGRIAARALLHPATTTDSGRLMNGPYCFAESLRLFTLMEAGVERARTLRDWGEAKLAAGESPAGRDRLRAARELFAQLDTPGEVARTDQLLAAFPAPAA